jgi:uncharacterized protein YdhG (YjbR/CyaY superfamily)
LNTPIRIADRERTLAKADTVDGYIATLPADVQPIIEEIRRLIRATIPDSGEKISYNMPTVTIDGNALIYFAAWKHHIGIYPIPTLDDELESEVRPLRAAKDTVKFPLDKPIPYDLLSRIALAVLDKRRLG